MYKIREIEYGNRWHEKHPTRIKKILKEKGITQKALANGTGIAKSTISKIVSGLQVDILLRTAKSIANYLECTIDELFGEGILTEKQLILKEIDKVISGLNHNDATGYVYYGKFQDLVTQIIANQKK